jgi:hypothetical protein
LAQLAAGRRCAARLGLDAWSFAMELGCLLVAGATAVDLRWLIAREYLDMATETTEPGDSIRSFHSLRSPAFTPQTCFVLTDAGMQWLDAGAVGAADAVRADAGVRLHAGADGAGDAFADASPWWDAIARELRLAGQLVKRYGHASPNQEAVLAAFQEEGWPRRIDDPLSPVRGLDPKRRLRDTVFTLNAKQQNRLIRFRAGGTGEHVLWELTAQQTAIRFPNPSDLHRAA